MRSIFLFIFDSNSKKGPKTRHQSKFTRKSSNWSRSWTFSLTLSWQMFLFHAWQWRIIFFVITFTWPPKKETTHLYCHYHFGESLLFEGKIEYDWDNFEICRFPFDWKNPIGFTFAITITHIFSVFVMTFIAQIMSIGIGSNLCLVSLTKDIKRVLHRTNQSGKVSSNHHEAMKNIAEYVQFHSKAKELSLYTPCVLTAPCQ